MFQQVTKAEFREALRQRLGSAEGRGAFWTDAVLDAKILDALRYWNLLTGYWSARYIAPVTSGAHFITLPSALILPARVQWRGVPLHLTSLFELDQACGTWQGVTGTPTAWVPVALNLIALYPASSVSDNSLTVDAIYATPTLPAETSYVDLEESLFQALLNYARHAALVRLPGEQLKASAPAKQALWKLAGEHNRRLKASALYRDVMGLPKDSAQEPLTEGKPTLGVR